MAPRLQLHDVLTDIVDHVYFQPPNNIQMQYPCIIYSRDSDWSEFGDNIRYAFLKRYQVTVVDRNPDSALPDKVEDLPLCRFNRFYAADNLNHFVYQLYF